METDQSKTPDLTVNKNKIKQRMAKKSGTKHHVVIKLGDLNKMFKENDVIPVPKGFVKSIAYMLSAHAVSLDEVNKDTGNSIEAHAETEVAAETASETKVQVTETVFED
jgi:hypothetical protein